MSKIIFTDSDINAMAYLKSNKDYSHCDIAILINKGFGLKGDARVKPRKIKAMLKGVVSKREDNRKEAVELFDSFFDRLESKNPSANFVTETSRLYKYRHASQLPPHAPSVSTGEARHEK